MPMAGSPFPPQGNKTLIGRYKNQYGTDVGLDYGLNTGSVGGHVNVPIGDHQSGVNVGLSGFYRPAGSSGPGDAGAVLTFKKVNLAEASNNDVFKKYQNEPTYLEWLKADPNRLEKARRELKDQLNRVGSPGSSNQEYQFGVVPEGSMRPDGSVSTIVGQDGQYTQQPQMLNGPAYLNQYIQRNMLGN